MKKIAIIGAGISGLYIANLFKDHKDYQVTIYEKRNSIEMEEGYGTVSYTHLTLPTTD